MPIAPSLCVEADDVDEFVDQIDRVFGVRFTVEAPLRALTMGELLVELKSRVGHDSAGACLTSMAFYRLRTAIRASFPDFPISPDSALAALPISRPASFLTSLSRASGLSLPDAQPRWLGKIGSIAIASGLFLCPAVAVFWHSWWVALGAAGAISIGVGLSWLDPGAFPTSCVTVGDLARRAASRNLSHLAREGGGVREADLWPALLEAANDIGTLSRHEQIGPETGLFA